MDVSDKRIDTWFPPGTYLREKTHPRFHDELLRLGRHDISWKIDSCCCSAHRLDCWSFINHITFVPVACNRRTCPECSRHRYREEVYRYSKIEDIARHLDSIAENRRIRFWTFTAYHAPDLSDFRPFFLKLTKAVRSWFHSTHDLTLDGGLFTLEVGVKGGPHVHALISGPFLRAKLFRQKWENALKRADLSGNRIQARLATPGATLELVAYPLDPEKVKGLDEKLLALTEHGLSGNRDLNLPSIRRQWTMGSWAGAFPPKRNQLPCPDCKSEGYIQGMTIDHDLDDIHGHGYKRDWYINHPERWPKK
jgi:hypothetical protein